MEQLKNKREELLKELNEIQARYNNLAGNMRMMETRMVEIQGAIKAIDELLNPESEQK